MDPKNQLRAAGEARKSAHGRELGEIPACESPTRREGCRRDFKRFCESYLPHLFALHWSNDHLKVLVKTQRAILEGGLFALAMPRGSGKTTIFRLINHEEQADRGDVIKAKGVRLGLLSQHVHFEPGATVHESALAAFGHLQQIEHEMHELEHRMADPEGELEKVMVEFFHHEIDMLLCTTIVESGMDIPKANTMFIDNSQQLGLSQLYQLRGRVGRSKERAYCYLLVPNHQKLDKDAQERLRIIQENTSLGSGIRIAQYDLELRGAGNLLGGEQHGHDQDREQAHCTDSFHQALPTLAL